MIDMSIVLQNFAENIGEMLKNPESLENLAREMRKSTDHVSSEAHNPVRLPETL
jgi:hypothetical protein